MPRSLVVKVTCGSEDAERCNQAFTVASTDTVNRATINMGDGGSYGGDGLLPNGAGGSSASTRWP